jgi:hypothetical protein
MLDEYAARQYGVFSLRQTRQLGFTKAMIETRRNSGAWIRLASSVYTLASAPPKWERQMAAALLSRPGSLVAGGSAAHVHDFPRSRPGRPTIMVGEDGNARSPLAKVIRSRFFADIEMVRKLAFPTTNEPETIVTMARSTSPDHLERIVDEVLARGSSTADELWATIGARAGTPGLPRLRRVVAERLPLAYQPPTSEPDLPRTTRQMPFAFERVNATVDLYVPAWRLIVEADGRRWHSRKADQERDRLRDNEAVAHGYVVLRFTWEMLTKSPTTSIDTLRRTGRIRSVF